MKNNRLKAVIFDMDGVITNTMPYHFRAWRKIFAKNGVKVSKFDIYRREGQKGTESIQEIFAEAGIKISIAKARQVIDEKETLFKTIVRRRFIPGARPLLKALYRSKMRLALVTGTAFHEVKRALPHDLFDVFEVMITGSDVLLGKPHPDPYLKALEALKISREEALVIENAPFGIQSAKAAGISCYAIATSLPPEYLKEADKILRDYQELLKMLLS